MLALCVTEEQIERTRMIPSYSWEVRLMRGSQSLCTSFSLIFLCRCIAFSAVISFFYNKFVVYCTAGIVLYILSNPAMNLLNEKDSAT